MISAAQRNDIEVYVMNKVVDFGLEITLQGNYLSGDTKSSPSQFNAEEKGSNSKPDLIIDEIRDNIVFKISGTDKDINDMINEVHKEMIAYNNQKMVFYMDAYGTEVPIKVKIEPQRFKCKVK